MVYFRIDDENYKIAKIARIIAIFVVFLVRFKRKKTGDYHD